MPLPIFTCLRCSVQLQYHLKCTHAYLRINFCVASAPELHLDSFLLSFNFAIKQSLIMSHSNRSSEVIAHTHQSPAKGMLDLPNELLSYLPLTRPNLLRMIRVCQRFRTVFNEKLYEEINLENHGTDRFYTSPSNPNVCVKCGRQPGYTCRCNCHTRQKVKLPLLLETLSSPSSSHLLRTVRMVTLGYEGLWSDHELVTAADRLLCISSSTLRYLSLSGGEVLRQSGRERFPQLEKLVMTPWHLGDTRYQQTAIRHLLRQPRFRSLEWQGHGQSTDSILGNPPDTQNISVCPPFNPLRHQIYRQRKGQELVLNSVTMNAEQVRELISAFSSLKTLMFVRSTSYCSRDVVYVLEHEFSSCCGRLRIADLAESLELSACSLESLTIIRSTAELCVMDMSVLPSLRNLVELRRLRIDVAYLLGYHRSCSDPLQGEPYPVKIFNRPARELATLLPTGLERLDLHVCQGEVAHNPKHCNELLQSLLDNKARLNSLAHVVIDEINGFASRCCYGHRHGEPYQEPYREPLSDDRCLPDSPVTESMIREMQETCLAVGICLTYIKRRAGKAKKFFVNIYKCGKEVHEVVVFDRFQYPCFLYDEDCGICEDELQRLEEEFTSQVKS